jgi:hypothetical protein
MGVAAGLTFLAAVAACTPKIGDSCNISTDCSSQGDRLCDTSQPSGYCTQLNCAQNSCPDEASCVLFGSAIPGCGFDDRSGPGGSRVARSFCMAQCDSNSDCRPGYVCADPKAPPWNATILDDNQIKRSCLPAPVPDAAPVIPSNAPVCQATTADAGRIEASAPNVDAATTVPPFYPPRDASADGG